MVRKGVFRAGIPAVLLMLLWLMCCTTAHAASMDAIWPESPEYDVRSDGKLVIDASNMNQGYVMVKTSSPTKKALKVTVSQGKWQLIYELNGEVK